MENLNIQTNNEPNELFEQWSNMENLEVKSYETISDEVAKRIISESIFPNDEGKTNAINDGYLLPKYKLGEVDNTNYYSSEILDDLFGGRPYIALFVEGKEGIKPRMFYRSDSSLSWRYLPEIHSNGWHDKSSFGEDAINAPFKIQKQLEEINSNHSESINYCDIISVESTISDIKTDIDDEVSERFSLAPDHIEVTMNPWGGVTYILPDPEDIRLPREMWPDFENEIDEYDIHSEVYKKMDSIGTITARRFKSQDGNYEFLFYSNSEGKTWIAGIECIDSDITSYGIRSQFIRPGALTTPLLEYHCEESCQDGKKGGGYWGKKQYGYYTDMSDYLDKIPVIKEFREKYS